MFSSVPRSADGQIGGLLPLRLLLRRLESGGTSDLCLRCVDSRVGYPAGAGEVVAAALLWNNGDGALSPPRRGLLGLSRRASGGLCSWIRRSVGLLYSRRGCCGRAGDHVVEFLFPRSSSAAARLPPASWWSSWGWCGGRSMLGVGCVCHMYRRWFSAGLSGDEALRSRSSATTSPATPSSGCWSLWAFAWMTSQLPYQQWLATEGRQRRAIGILRRKGVAGPPGSVLLFLSFQGVLCNVVC